MELPAYSGVVIFAGQDEEGNNIEYRAGDQTGTLLEITNEWGSQAQADAIYKKIRGYRYQPYKASGTHIDPSVEIGDAVTIADTYGGVFLRATTYGRDITSELEAPSKEEIEHEFQIQSPTNRQYERFTRSVRASLTLSESKIAAEVEDRKAEDNVLRATLQVQANAIEARVTKEGGDASSFWWKLLSDSWSVGSGNQEILGVRKGGAYITGEIRATSGKIGGFDIMSDYLSYNGQTWGGTNSWGAYIGRDGFQMGNKFRVDMSGYLYANSGRFEGEVRAGSISYGGDDGTLWGEAITSESLSGGWGGQIASGGISTYNTTGGINESLGYADFANGVFNGWNEAPEVAVGSLKIDGHYLNRASISIGNTRYKLVTWI
nr:MAG TPA: hypothetical protein [Caudoviricetes sp.]